MPKAARERRTNKTQKFGLLVEVIRRKLVEEKKS